MNAGAHERVKELLSQAAAMPVDERRSFIEQAAGDDSEIAREAIALLATLDDPAFLAAPTHAGMTLDAGRRGNAPGDRSGQRIGRYTLLDAIGEGGFGTVYLAEQTEPVQRRVAIKVLKAGMDSQQVVARFEAERQALAMMDHPNIASVHDGGHTTDGRPYFVMELVRGDAITHYCDREQLPVRQRLTLFRDICQAVQHAHQKGIIHRDIKPRNVLVTVIDGRPSPKVIDFGIAKALQARLTDRTYFTELHQVIGTPEYMSPEQADTATADIDTRSDIYSLGALLYELLTGTTPFEAGKLHSMGYARMLRFLVEAQPPRPSTRLNALATGSDSADGAAVRPAEGSQASSIIAIARRRRTEPPALRRALRGELDWIVMKCLEKDRSRRYETASALAEDVVNYLEQRPVRARAPGTLYRLSKFAQRHRAGVAVGGIGMALMLAGTIALATFALRASTARENERSERIRAEAALQNTQRHRRLAEEQAEEARQAAAFHAGMLATIDIDAMGRAFQQRYRDQIRAALQRHSVGEWPDRRLLTADEVESELAEFDSRVTVVQPTDVARGLLDEFVLRRAVDAARSRFTAQSLVQASIQLAIGDVYRQLGMLDQASALIREALQTHRRQLGDHDPAVGRTLNSLAIVQRATGNYDDAAASLNEAIAIGRQHLGVSDPVVLDWQTNLAALHDDRSQFAESELQYRELIERGCQAGASTHSRCGEWRIRLAVVLLKQGRQEEAESLGRQGVSELESAIGDDQPDLARGWTDLAHVLMAGRKLDEAEQLFRQSLDLLRRVLGDEHWEVCTAMINLAGFLNARADYKAAESQYREALGILRRVVGTDHPTTAMCMGNLAVTLKSLGKREESESLSREALRIRRKVYGDCHSDVAKALNSLAMSLKDRGEFTEAERLYREALAMNRKLHGDSHESVGRTLNHIALLLTLSNRLPEAEAACNEALAVNRRVAAGQGTGLAVSLNNLANLYKLQDRLADAEPLYRQALEVNRREYPTDHPAVATSLSNLALIVLARGDAGAAENDLREALKIFERRLPPQHDQVIAARIHLADALVRLNRFEDGSALVHEAAAAIPSSPNLRPVTRDDWRRVGLALYEAWNAEAPSAERARQLEAYKSMQDKQQQP